MENNNNAIIEVGSLKIDKSLLLLKPETQALIDFMIITLSSLDPDHVDYKFAEIKKVHDAKENGDKEAAEQWAELPYIVKNSYCQMVNINIVAGYEIYK